MKYTQFCIFETGSYCNLQKLHTQCPSASKERYINSDQTKLMSDELIINTAIRLYKEFGFRGLIGFHLYNEPTLFHKRNIKLIREIRKQCPESRYVYWTNGMYLDKIPLDELNIFEKIFISIYNNINLDILKEYNGEKNFRNGELDNRISAPIDNSNKKCLRMFSEIIFDAYGQTEICCYDFSKQVKVGNINTDKLEDIIKRWTDIRESMLLEMTPKAPSFCRQCSKRADGISDMDGRIQRDAQQYVQEKLNDSNI